jgi:predicted amidohydrolase YtcJ
MLHGAVVNYTSQQREINEQCSLLFAVHYCSHAAEAVHTGENKERQRSQEESRVSCTVFTGGTVVVAASREGRPDTSTAIAFEDGHVVALGPDAEALADRADHLVDLREGTLAPAPGDGHAHPVFGALESAGPNVRAANNLDELLEAVATYKIAHPDAEWIVGGSYDATFAPGGKFDAHWLDQVTGDTPTILRSWDYHTAWVNTAALRAAEITTETPDPPLGRIVRREDGSPLGTLQEAAANNFLAEVAPQPTLEQRTAAVEQATKEYAELGMTWVQDAWVEPGDIEHYLAASAADRLHTRVNLALRADPFTWRDQVAQFTAERERVHAHSLAQYGPRERGAWRLSAHTVKFFLDGVIENHTALLTEPYADRPHDRGLPNWSAESLRDAVLAFGAAGFQLHLHAIGDAANQLALDSLEALQVAHPELSVPHVIAHVAMLAPGQAERFAELGIIANFEPFWAQCDAVMRALTIPHIGHDRESWQYLIGSVHRSGAVVSFGSDWPVTTKDWRPALSTAVMRHSHLEPDAESWLPDERIDAPDAFAAYTQGIAQQALSPERGTLKIGQVADAVWLSADPTTVAPIEVPNIQVHGTWLSGTRTFTSHFAH